MRKTIKTFLNWSSGKDAAMALYYLQKNPDFQVDHLLTSVNGHFDRVSMHGVRRSLLKKQIEAIGLPHTIIELPEEPGMAEYESIMGEQLKILQAEGFTCSAFGDIFLEDLRNYRENKLKEINMQAAFPLWNKNTKMLLNDFLNHGFKAIVVCINADLMDASFVGRIIDKDFIKDLPGNVDPCGENGEFHTFCFDGPVFKHPIDFTIGEKIFKEYKAPKEDAAKNTNNMGFWFCDLIPESDFNQILKLNT